MINNQHIENEIYQMKTYRVKKIVSNLGDMPNGSCAIVMSTEAQIAKANSDGKLIVTVTVEFTNKDTDSLVLQVITEALIMDSSHQSTNKDNESDSEAVMLTYEKTRSIIDEIAKLSNVRFMSPPPFKNLVEQVQYE